MFETKHVEKHKQCSRLKNDLHWLVFILIPMHSLLQVPDSMLWENVSNKEWCKKTLREEASVCFPVGLNHKAVSNY